MSTILELLNELPEEMMMRNHANGVEKTVKEWKESPGVQRESRSGSDNYQMHDSPYGYGCYTHKVIFYPRAGIVYSEVISLNA